MIRSHWGDSEMFFQHGDPKKDIHFHPEWESAMPSFVEPAGTVPVELITPDMTKLITRSFDDAAGEKVKANVRASIIETGCPFKWVFESMYGEGATPESIAA